MLPTTQTDILDHMDHYITPTELLLLLALFGSPAYGAALAVLGWWLRRRGYLARGQRRFALLAAVLGLLLALPLTVAVWSASAHVPAWPATGSGPIGLAITIGLPALIASVIAFPAATLLVCGRRSQHAA